MNQIWLRHRNGGGRKFGNNCEVSADTYLDRKSSVGDSVEVYSSQIIESLISGEVIISNARIHTSTVKDTCRLIGSGPGINVVNSELSGNTRVWDQAVVMDAAIENVRVYGNAILQGPWELREFVRIHRGIWRRPPQHRLLEGENIDVVLSECVDDHFHLGCWCLPRETWFRKGYRQRLGKRSGWTPQQIELAYDAFSTWACSRADREEGKGR